MKRLFLLCLALMLPQAAAAQDGPLRWVAYYGNDATINFSAYHLIVLHPNHNMPVRQINTPQKTVLAYVSIGEGGSDQPDYSLLNERKLLMDSPAHWPGNRLIDVRNPAWTAYLVEELIPAILDEGFDGIMLDTLDTPLDAEKRDPALFTGMRSATIGLVQTIRAHYPEITIMVNRGFEILPEIARDTDFLLAESILSDYKRDGTSTFFPQTVYNSLSDMLASVKQRHPHLQLLTLDYWPLTDTSTIRQIYSTQRAKGFIPYVGPFELHNVTPEP